MTFLEYDHLIHAIAASADHNRVIEDLRIYTNWVLVKTGRWVALNDISGHARP